VERTLVVTMTSGSICTCTRVRSWPLWWRRELSTLPSSRRGTATSVTGQGHHCCRTTLLRLCLLYDSSVMSSVMYTSLFLSRIRTRKATKKLRIDASPSGHRSPIPISFVPITQRRVSPPTILPFWDSIADTSVCLSPDASQPLAQIFDDF
jgi:hypothetical protein